jgi:hypothetical protein
MALVPCKKPGWYIRYHSNSSQVSVKLSLAKSNVFLGAPQVWGTQKIHTAIMFLC